MSERGQQSSPGWFGSLLASRTEEGIPRARFTPTVAAKFLTDELLHAGTMAVSRRRLDTPHVRERFRSELCGLEQLFDEHGWISDPMSFHVDPPSLTLPDIRWTTRGGVDFEHLSFESGYEPRAFEPGRERWLSYGANKTAHVWMMRHRRVDRPWLVCVNGYRTGFAAVDLVAFRLQQLHRLGLNVACYVLPLHGPRRAARWSGDRFFRAGYVNTIHGIAQAVWDLRRLLGWIRRQDTGGVGLYGLSLGGYAAAVTAAFDEELACVIAGIPATDFVRVMKGIAPESIVRYAEELGIGWESAEKIMRVVAPLALTPKVPHNRRYIFGGLVDRVVDPTQVRDLWLHWDKPRIAWYHGNHFSFNGEPEVRTLIREALQDSGLAGAGI